MSAGQLVWQSLFTADAAGPHLEEFAQHNAGDGFGDKQHTEPFADQNIPNGFPV